MHCFFLCVDNECDEGVMLWRKFSAVCGISNNRKAIEIRSNLDKEKQETLETLRLMREEREQKAKVS